LGKEKHANTLAAQGFGIKYQRELGRCHNIVSKSQQIIKPFSLPLCIYQNW
jgi:hypothetical protein